MTDHRPIRTPAHRPPRHTRRASAYVLVLGIAMLVMVIGAGTIAAIQAEARSAADLGDIGAARLYAASAIDLGQLWIANDPDWRNTRANGVWATDQPIGDGTFTLEVVNPAGALNRSPSDPVVMTATGKSGKARHKTQVTLTPTPTPLSCLGAALCAGGPITFTATTVLAINQLIASNAAVTAVGASINSNVESVLAIGGVTYHGTTTSAAPARQMPDTSVFDYYKGAGTNVGIGSLGSGGSGGGGGGGGGGTANLTQCVLSPANNPLGGGSNPNGIYIIDCQGQTLVISDCRIVGTLVLINPGPGSAVQGSVNWSPAVSGLPCLLVKGSFAINTTGTALAESNTTKVSYNPPGTPYPYPGGTSNSTFTDSFPSVIDGLVYVSGNVTTGNAPAVKMLVVGGSFMSTGTLTLSYDPAVLASPPPGFYTSATLPVPGTWSQSVN